MKLLVACGARSLSAALGGPAGMVPTVHIRGRCSLSRGRAMGDEFPLHDEVEDFAGKRRRFVISCYSTPLGHTVRAVEEDTNGDGYEFAAYSETTPYSALGRVRDKMRSALATRHLAGQPGRYEMTHDTMRGRITVHGHHDVVLVVDGIPLDLNDVATILGSHEGWSFELRIRDSLE